MIAIVGAGAAGLAVAHQLRVRGIESTLFEAEDVGHVWGRHYDRLHLHTLKQVSGLPGLAMPGHYPNFPSAEQVREYLCSYRHHFGFDVRTGVRIASAEWDGSSWILTSSEETFEAKVIVAATGIWSTPWRPSFDGIEGFAGQVLHSSEYRSPDTVRGDRVLVVGAGNSGSEIAVELAAAGRDVAVSVRSGASFVPRPTSVAVSRVTAYLLRSFPPHVANLALKAVRRDYSDIGLPLPLTCPIYTYPVVGFELPEAVASGQIVAVPEVRSFGPDRVEFVNRNERVVDSVVLATGFRPTLGWVPSGAVELRENGRPAVDENSRSVRHAALYCVGFDYPNTEGWLQAIGRVAGHTAAAIAQQLRFGRP